MPPVKRGAAPHDAPGSATFIAWKEARAFFVYDSLLTTLYGLDTGEKLIIWSHKWHKSTESYDKLAQVVLARSGLPLRDIRDITESACAIGGTSSMTTDLWKAVPLGTGLERPAPDTRLASFHPAYSVWKSMTPGAMAWLVIMTIALLSCMASFVLYLTHS